MKAQLDVLIPTCDRPAALAVTLTSLTGQIERNFRVVVSDQSENGDAAASGEVRAAARVLEARGRPIEFHKHLPRRGMAEQRYYLLEQSSAPYTMYLDDDLILEADTIARLITALRLEGCGFAGCAAIGLSYLHDVRPHEQAIEFWKGLVQPEEVLPGSPAWERHKLHNAANVYHVQQRMKPGEQRRYRVAWIGGCVMYDRAALLDCGGFEFWRELPPNHCGEDVLAQLRVMARYGGFGLLPSGVYHQELPTTLPDRSIDAPKVLSHDSSAVFPGHPPVR